MLKMSTTWTYTRMGTLSKILGQLRMIWQAQNTRWKKSLFISIRAEYTRGFNCPHR